MYEIFLRWRLLGISYKNPLYCHTRLSLSRSLSVARCHCLLLLFGLCMYWVDGWVVRMVCVHMCVPVSMSVCVCVRSVQVFQTKAKVHRTHISLYKFEGFLNKTADSTALENEKQFSAKFFKSNVLDFFFHFEKCK